MNHLDLCSGIGGFALGLQRAGPFHTVAFVEPDGFCQRVLEKNFPGVQIIEKVEDVAPNGLGRLDIVTAGWPCQPFSAIGLQRGEEDHRHLWPEVHRVVDSARPRWFIGENVVGLSTMGLDGVLLDLERSGYTAQALVLPACAVDAPHRRDRVFILAHTERAGLEGHAEHELQRDQPGRIGEGQDGPTCPPRLCFGGVGPRWKAEPDVRRVVNGVPDRMDRIAALGNAVVPQLVTRLGQAILEIEADA